MIEILLAWAAIGVTVVVASVPGAWRWWRGFRQRRRPLRVEVMFDTSPPWDVGLLRLPEPADFPVARKPGPGEVHAVSRLLGGVACRSLRVQLTLTNPGPLPVTVNDVGIVICSRSDVDMPIYLQYPSGGGGTLISLLFDLDEEYPLPRVGEYVGGHLQLNGNSWSQGARQSIAPNSSLPVNVEARALRQLTAFSIRLVVQVDGCRVDVLVDDEGKPFQLLGDQGSADERHFVWRWDLGGIAARGTGEVMPEWKSRRTRF